MNILGPGEPPPPLSPDLVKPGICDPLENKSLENDTLLV